MTNPEAHGRAAHGRAAHGRAAHGRAVIPITRAQVDAALLLLEHVDIPAANCVRAYIRRLESAINPHDELEDDEDPYAWSYSWEQGE